MWWHLLNIVCKRPKKVFKGLKRQKRPQSRSSTKLLLKALCDLCAAAHNVRKRSSGLNHLVKQTSEETRVVHLLTATRGQRRSTLTLSLYVQWTRSLIRFWTWFSPSDNENRLMFLKDLSFTSKFNMSLKYKWSPKKRKKTTTLDD